MNSIDHEQPSYAAFRQPNGHAAPAVNAGNNMSSHSAEHDRDGGSTGVTSSEALDREKVEGEAAAGKKDGAGEGPALSKGKIAIIMTALSVRLMRSAVPSVSDRG